MPKVHRQFVDSLREKPSVALGATEVLGGQKRRPVVSGGIRKLQYDVRVAQDWPPARPREATSHESVGAWRERDHDDLVLAVAWQSGTANGVAAPGTPVKFPSILGVHAPGQNTERGFLAGRMEAPGIIRSTLRPRSALALVSDQLRSLFEIGQATSSAGGAFFSKRLHRFRAAIIETPRAAPAPQFSRVCILTVG
jgi:hypothetical protein